MEQSKSWNTAVIDIATRHTQVGSNISAPLDFCKCRIIQSMMGFEIEYYKIPASGYET